MNSSILEKKWDLHPIWNVGISIYYEIACICEKHGLRYFAGYGTALGAVRHNGFIPWDDDIDLLMPRSDYEVFFSLASNELPSHLQAIKEPIIEGYRLSFGKVFEKNSDTLDKVRKEAHFALKNGISVDVFPMDGCPANFMKFYFWQGRISVMNAMLWSRAAKSIPSNLSLHLYVRFWIGKIMNVLFFRHSDTSKLEEIKKKAIRCYDYDSAEMAGVVGSEYGVCTLRIPKEIYGKGKKIAFEQIMIQVPMQCEKYLEYIYGDYMRLPPLDEQLPKHLLEEYID